MLFHLVQHEWLLNLMSYEVLLRDKKFPLAGFKCYYINLAKFRPELSNFELKINCRCRSLGERLYQNFVIYVHAHKYKQAPARVNHLKTKENTSIMMKVRKPKLF